MTALREFLTKKEKCEVCYSDIKLEYIYSFHRKNDPTYMFPPNVKLIGKSSYLDDNYFMFHEMDIAILQSTNAYINIDTLDVSTNYKIGYLTIGITRACKIPSAEGPHSEHVARLFIDPASPKCIFTEIIKYHENSLFKITHDFIRKKTTILNKARVIDVDIVEDINLKNLDYEKLQKYYNLMK